MRLRPTAFLRELSCCSSLYRVAPKVVGFDRRLRQLRPAFLERVMGGPCQTKRLPRADAWPSNRGFFRQTGAATAYLPATILACLRNLCNEFQASSRALRQCERWRLVVQKYHRGACGGNIEDRFATIQICRLARLRCPSAQFIDARAAEHYSLRGVDGGSGEPHDGCGGEAASRLDHYPRVTRGILVDQADPQRPIWRAD